MYGMLPRRLAGTDDVTLAHQVESELFRAHHDAKGRVSVNAASAGRWIEATRNPTSDIRNPFFYSTFRIQSFVR